MSPSASPLAIDTGLARRILVAFLRKETGRAGFQRGLLGLSGGLDSAVTCYLAAEALGPENVLAVRMPFADSSPDSIEDADEVIRQTGVRQETVPITAMAEPLLATIPASDRVRRANVLARLRMIVLYDRSAAVRGLVLGTSNKSELLLGYTTIFGDSASAINPLGDLYKTQVRQLAADLGVPSRILAKPPSADLWPGQTDEAELGLTYAEADALMALLIDGRWTAEACVAAGFHESFVGDVVQRIRRSQYKRIPPVIAKLSNRTIGYDFLYLRDWGT